MKKREWQEKIKKFMSENRFLVKPFLVMLLIYLVGALAIILAGVHYADDVARTTFGYGGWNGFSRYFSTFFSRILHADTYLTNVAPLPQILALVILAVASVMLVYLVAGKEVLKVKKWGWYIVAAVPLGLTPYMLECLSYQYDAPYMAISVLFAILPVCFRDCKKWVYGLAILISVLVICTSYQAGIGIMVMMFIILAMRDWSEKRVEDKAVWKTFGFSCVAFLLSLLLFQQVLMRPRDAYASNSLPGINELIPKFFEHLGQYFSLVFSDFKFWWLLIIGMISIGFVVMFVLKAKRNKWAAVLVAVIGGLAIVVLAFAFYAVLDKPLYATRAMYPLGAAIAIFAVYAVSGEKKAGVLKIPVVILSYCFLVFALTYGNALKEQDNFRNMVMDMVTSDINELPMMQDGKTKNVMLRGSVGFSPVILNMPTNYTIMQRLLMPSYSEYVPWMAYKLTHQSGLHLTVVEGDLEEDELSILKETVLYNLYGDEENILVEFKGERAFEVVF